jgi:Fe-S-cluster containining protein
MSSGFSEKVPAPRQVDFSCNSCAKCCKDLIVNLKFADIGNILKNRSDLQINDFVDYIDEEEDYPYGIKGNLFGRQVPVLKQKGGSCIFLDKANLCTINDFKPLTCKIFPFKLEDDQAVFEPNLYQFLNTKCGYTLEYRQGKKEGIMADLLENKRVSQSFFKEIYEKNRAQKAEYISDLASCLSENLEPASEASFYELTSQDHPVTGKLPGKTNYFQKNYFSGADILKKEQYSLYSHLFFTHVLEFVREPAGFLRTLYPELSPGQPVIFTVKNSLHPLFVKFVVRPAGLVYSNVENPGVKELNYFSLKGLKKLMAENGFFIKNVFKYQQGFSLNLQKFYEIFSSQVSKGLGNNSLKDFEQEKHSFSYIIIAYKMKD